MRTTLSNYLKHHVWLKHAEEGFNPTDFMGMFCFKNISFLVDRFIMRGLFRGIAAVGGKENGTAW